MKILIQFFIPFVLALRCIGAELSGQVFIVTKGGESIKLGLVPINAYRFDELKARVEHTATAAAKELEKTAAVYAHGQKSSHQAYEEEKRVREQTGILSAEANIAEKRWKQLDDAVWQLVLRRRYFNSGLLYFGDLPTPLASTKTDADGKFSVDLPPGKYGIGAHSRRMIGDSTDEYYWLVPVVMDGTKKIMLSNDNLTSAEGESLVHTIASKLEVDMPNASTKNDEALARAMIEAEKAAAPAPVAVAPQPPMQQGAGAIAPNAGASTKPPSADSAQQRAIQVYPDLGIANSPLNQEFVRRYSKYQVENKSYFNNPEWPTILAKESKDALTHK